jgi:hypothetical protein
MKLEGCKTKSRHLFVGSKKKAGAEEKVETVRYGNCTVTNAQGTVADMT